MSTPIEALSISSLTNLLANPPQYPRNPTHQPHAALVLYIVRVPGSKDVFLTPLKPPTKASISLEAIQSSLYYLHVETPEDEILRKSLEAERQAESQSIPYQPIWRKPLPPTLFANYPASQRPPTPPKSYPHYQPLGFSQNGDTQAERYISRGSHIRLTSNNQAISRKPLGARPLRPQPVTDENISPSATSPTVTSEAGDTARRWSVPDFNPMPWTPRSQVAETILPSDGAQSQDLGTESSTNSIGNESTIVTLIRRDPTSGIQWNVGTIKLESRRHSLALLQPVDMVLTAPGYSKFACAPQSPERDGSSASASPVNDMVFRRRLGFRPLPDHFVPSLHHLRANSGDFMSDLTTTSVKKVRQVYSFTSPWQGICTFSNGVDGKSLKCRHSLPSSQSQQTDTSVGSAELRFNLPWSVLRPRNPNRLAKTEADKLPISQLLGKTPREQLRRRVQSLKPKSWHPRIHSSTVSEGQPPTILQPADESIDDETRLSLRLGREKAGGGFKGHSAKLGKLIVEDEGLKMCDLTVAACMGVWWQHYMDSDT